MKRPLIILIPENLRYLKLILPLLAILEFSTPAHAQPAAITNVTASTSSFCDGGALTVSYTVVPEGSFNNGNVFTAELSNASGDFSSPVTIGTSVSINSGNISAVIPPGTGYGTQYRIRVISSNPVVTSDPNTSDITVNVSPTPPLTGTITQPTCACPDRQCSPQRSAFFRNMDPYKKPGSSDFHRNRDFHHCFKSGTGNLYFHCYRCLRMRFTCNRQCCN